MSDNYLDDLFIDEVSGALKPRTKPSTVLNVSEKTEADTDYTVEVKIDPVAKKLYVPASTIQTTPTEPDTEEVTE